MDFREMYKQLQKGKIVNRSSYDSNKTSPRFFILIKNVLYRSYIDGNNYILCPAIFFEEEINANDWYVL